MVFGWFSRKPKEVSQNYKLPNNVQAAYDDFVRKEEAKKKKEEEKLRKAKEKEEEKRKKEEEKRKKEEEKLRIAKEKQERKEAELAPARLHRRWREDPNWKGVVDVNTEGDLLDRYNNKEALTPDEYKKVDKILDKARKQKNKNNDARANAMNRLIAQGVDPEQAYDDTRHFTEAPELSRVGQAIDKFNDSKWGQSKIGKAIVNFHTKHGDAATIGAGAAALGLTALAGYGLYKGVKKLFGKKKEQPKPKIDLGVVPGQAAYNTMPARQDQKSYPYPFPMQDPNYKLPPGYADITQKDVSDYLAYLKTQGA